jgi:hypothetical protein
MQGNALITKESLFELVEFIFESGGVTVFQAYSHFDEALREFKVASELICDMEAEMENSQKLLFYTLHYSDAMGSVSKRKIYLNPRSADGHTWRWKVEGWGLIDLQAGSKQIPKIDCRIAVNSQKRAERWAEGILELGDPNGWDWKIVEKYAGRLIRRMKKLAI